ncbi:MAG: DNA-processing protein DprA, partial [bacterium]|nr:DNA-processing protein DprA [bacterium]
MMKELNSSTIYYNALAIQHRGNFSALKRLKEKYPNWEKAFKREFKLKEDAHELSHELKKQGVRLILQEDKDFPPLLQEIPHPPLALYCKGNIKIDKALAIVGTRKAGKPSLIASAEISKNLASLGLSIISGLALGVDSYAHKGALATGGHTVAVLANGLDRIYPSSNNNLANQILKNGGALISEYPLGTEPLRNLFIARNRIISGLSQAVLVIEAPQKSGALATARFAVEQNRDLYVLPGPARDKNFLGSNRLIQDGASLIIDAHDIAKDFGLETEGGKTVSNSLQFDKLSKMQTIIVIALKKLSKPVGLDEIAQETRLEISELQTNLTQLMLDG